MKQLQTFPIGTLNKDGKYIAFMEIYICWGKKEILFIYLVNSWNFLYKYLITLIKNSSYRFKLVILDMIIPKCNKFD